MSQELICLKLASSEELVANLTEETPNEFVVTKARAVMTAPNQERQSMGISFEMPWCFCACDEEIKINKSCVTGSTKKILPQLEAAYLEVTDRKSVV